MTFANGVIGSLSWIELALVMFFAICLLYTSPSPRDPE